MLVCVPEMWMLKAQVKHTCTLSEFTFQFAGFCNSFLEGEVKTVENKKGGSAIKSQSSAEGS